MPVAQATKWTRTKNQINSWFSRSARSLQNSNTELVVHSQIIHRHPNFVLFFFFCFFISFIFIRCFFSQMFCFLSNWKGWPKPTHWPSIRSRLMINLIKFSDEFGVRASSSAGWTLRCEVSSHVWNSHRFFFIVSFS
jgi:hypothetical protein